MSAAARAAFNLGITTDDTTQSLFKAMENGKLMAEEFLPELSKELLIAANQGGALEEAMESTSSALGRFQTNVWIANKTFNESGFDEGVRNLVNTVSNFIYESEELWNVLGAGAGILTNALRGPFELLNSFTDAIGSAVDKGEEFNLTYKHMALIFFSLFKWSRKLLAVFVLLPLTMSAIARAWDEGGFGNWATALGLAAASALVFRRRIKSVIDLFRAGRGAATSFAAAASGGAVAGSGGAAAKSSPLASKAAVLTAAGVAVGSTLLGGVALGSLARDAVKNPTAETGIGFNRRRSDMNLGEGSEEKTFSDKIGRAGEDLNKFWNWMSGKASQEGAPRNLNRRGGIDPEKLPFGQVHIGKSQPPEPTIFNEYLEKLDKYLYGMGEGNTKGLPNYLLNQNNRPSNQYSVGNVTINVETPSTDPESVAEAVSDRFIGDLLRTTSGSEPITER